LRDVEGAVFMLLRSNAGYISPAPLRFECGLNGPAAKGLFAPS
jgi:hypothetical protein